MVDGHTRGIPYIRPQIRLVCPDTDDDLLDIMETSGEPGPGVYDDPEDPGPGSELVNLGSVWVEEN